MHRVSMKYAMGSSTEVSLEAGSFLDENVVVPCRARRRSMDGSDGWCRGLQGPCRLVRLCLLGVLVPACLVAVPLYVRYHVLHEQQYPVAFSDVRLIDGHVSTTWCQGQKMRGNASFNAYLMPETPKYNNRPARVSMTRHMYLEDDMKEYWGFYLLPGSEVKVKACSRGPGASLIVIKGHKHLRDCAYIGDNSSEELDEMTTTEDNIVPESHEPTTDRMSTTSTASRVPEKIEPTHSDGKVARAAAPNPLVKEGRISTDSITSEEALDELVSKVSSLGPSGQRALRKLALQLHSKEQNDGKTQVEDELKDQMLVELIQQLLKNSGSRLTVTTAKDEDGDAIDRAKRSADNGSDRTKRSVDHKAEALQLLNEVIQEEKVILSRKRRIAALQDKLHAETDSLEDGAFEEGLEPDGIADTRGHLAENTTFDRSNDEEWSSFSSSEETLMKCEGLLLYLPLTPRRECSNPAAVTTLPVADTYSYTATTSGYYFFVFNSENEIEENLISVEFSLVRTTYNTSQRVAQCDNTMQCSFPLDFFSSEKVVLEVPVAPGKEGPSNSSADSLAKHWNEEYLVVSTCEPRTSLYLVCMILVPILILTFAFQ
ncbi:uncharacterized protein LOC135941429 isoform X2 [Cloeon dipterum]|uniref:uncharacterized protein LOC135941429 isoform X2 n=1 Tax=Cloeon dipterum TaxID=197152 RepID=UPI0032208377